MKVKSKKINEANAYNNKDEQIKPNPGSDEAIKAGCICDASDNNHGKGITIKIRKKVEVCFWLSADCPLHYKKEGEYENRVC